MKAIVIAAACHAVNAAYCAAIGDTSQVSWEDAPDWQKASAIAGVEMHLANPDATPEQSHESWLAQKLADGWTYGEVKNPDKKLHPCIRSYDELPVEQRVKDHLFKAVVASLKGMAEDAAPAPLTAPNLQGVKDALTVTPGAMLPVRYIGTRADYVDGAYGTRIRFTKGETVAVPAAIARKMFAHPDVYEPGDPLVAMPMDVGTEDGKNKDMTEEEAQIQRDAVQRMTKDQLVEYAKINFNQPLKKDLKVDEMRAQVTHMLDRFGLPG